LDAGYNLSGVTTGGDVTGVVLNGGGSGNAMETTLEFGGTYATTYHVTADVEGDDESVDATYWPKWWIKPGGKQADGVIIKASNWDIGGLGTAPTGWTYTFWIWRRE